MVLHTGPGQIDGDIDIKLSQRRPIAPPERAVGLPTGKTESDSSEQLFAHATDGYPKVNIF
jgi:hypothetical protein